MKLRIKDHHIISGEVCSQCNEPAVIKKMFSLDDHEWELYACRRCMADNEFYIGVCMRCSMPTRGDLCSVCEQELRGQRSAFSDTRDFLFAATAMFRYGAMRYPGTTS